MGNAMDDINPKDELRRSRKSTWHMQWVLVGLSGLLAVALLASGVVVIGGIIGVMAIVRAAMLARWQRDSETIGQRFRGNPPRS